MGTKLLQIFKKLLILLFMDIIAIGLLFIAIDVYIKTGELYRILLGIILIFIAIIFLTCSGLIIKNNE